MTSPLRHRLPGRRPCVTHKVTWATETSEHAFYVTIGFDPADGRPREVFYADGQKTGTALQHSVQDACVLISLLLQHGASLDAIGHSLSTVPLWGEERPDSAVGAIVAAMREGEA